MEIEFHGCYDRESFQKAIFLISLPSRRNQVLRLALSAVVLIGGIAVVVGTIVEGREVSARLLRIGVTALIVSYVLMQPYISAYLAGRRLWKDAGLRTAMSGMVSSQGITYVSGEARNEIRWERFARSRKSKDWIALLTADGTFSLLPYRFFQSDEEWNIFAKWVATKVVEPK